MFVGLKNWYFLKVLHSKKIDRFLVWFGFVKKKKKVTLDPHQDSLLGPLSDSNLRGVTLMTVGGPWP